MDTFKLPRDIFNHQNWNNPIELRLFRLLLFKARKSATNKGEYLLDLNEISNELYYIKENIKVKYDFWEIEEAIKQLTKYGLIEINGKKIITIIDFDKYFIE